MMDFTLKIYRELLVELKNRGYEFQTFRDFLKQPHLKVIMLRHDVDARNMHSLAFAEIQHEMGIQGTYYFRMVEGSFDKSIIRRMESLGHEIGYHYEDMDLAKGDPKLALEYFQQHINQLREVAQVNTLCMHGSPQSKYDNKEIWKHYRYQDYGFVGEPYFDLNFNEVFYLTDTGMMWDGFKVSVRDKVNAQCHWPVYHSTFDILVALRTEKFPEQVMFNFHPQRWTDNKKLWISEWIKQSVKNRVKRAFFVKK
jgi:hypothetical protein